MSEVLTVEKCLDLIQQSASAEIKKPYKERTKLTVKGKLIRIFPKTGNVDKFLQNVLLQGDTDPIVRLKVTLMGDSVDRLTESDLNTDQTFTGTASVYNGMSTGYEDEYSLFGFLGDGTRKGGGYRKYDSTGQTRGMLINNACAFKLKNPEASITQITDHLYECIAAVTPEVLKKALGEATSKPEETEDKTEESGEDPFEENKSK